VLEGSIDGGDPVEHSKDAADLEGMFDVCASSLSPSLKSQRLSSASRFILMRQWMVLESMN
jgi:hypothetical protein